MYGSSLFFVHNGEKTCCWEKNVLVKEKKANCWTEDELQEALHKLRSVPGSLVRSVAKEYGVSESTLRWRRKNLKEHASSLKFPGRKCVFIEEKEKKLAKCIGSICNPWV